MSKAAPEIMYWITVAAYFVTALLCAICAIRSNRRGIWWGLALGMLLLTINKQQDLLGLLTALGRSNAWNANWYIARGSIQIPIIAGMAVLGGVLLGIAMWLVRPLQGLMWLAITGFIFLLGFATMRAVSLHAIDVFLYTPHAGIYLNWVLELGGIALIVSAALVTLWRASKECHSLIEQPLEPG